MKKYAVAFDIDGSGIELSIIESTDSVSAIKKALLESCKDDESKEEQKEWELSFPDSEKELIDYLWNVSMTDVEVKEV